MERTRTYSWEDPAISAAALGSMSGLELLEAMRDGKVPGPPILATVDFELVEIEHGRIVFEMTPQEFQYNPIGSVHGGAISTIVDSALGCAVHSTLAAGTGYTSLDLNVRFLRGITVATGPVRAEGVVVASGRRTATAECRVTDTKGRLIAHATSSCLVFEIPAQPTAAPPTQ